MPRAVSAVAPLPDAASARKNTSSPPFARVVASALVVAVVAVVIRWPFLRVPMITDEGAYAYIARLWSDSTQLYRDLPLDRPQGLFLLYKLALMVGDDIAAIRLFAAAYHAGTCLAVWAFARDLFGSRAAVAAGFVAAVLGAAPGIEGFTANAEGFTLLPLVVSAHAAWRLRWGLAGALSGVAVCAKPSAISGLLLIIVWLAIVETRRARALLLALVGFAVAPAMSLGHGCAVGWDVYVAAFVSRRVRLYSVVGTPPMYQLQKLTRGVVDTFAVWALPFVGTIAALASRGVRDRRMQLVAVWFATSWPGMALGGEWHWHYFQQIVPPLAVGMGGIVDAPVRGWRRCGWGAALLLAASFFLARQGSLWSASPTEVSYRVYRRPGYLLQDAVAEEIRRRTAPGDRIYVAAAEAELYYLSDRVAVVPQLFMLELLDPALRARVIASLRAGEPKLVIAVQPLPGMVFDEFVELLEPNYARVADVAGIAIFQRTSR